MAIDAAHQHCIMTDVMDSAAKLAMDVSQSRHMLVAEMGPLFRCAGFKDVTCLTRTALPLAKFVVSDLPPTGHHTATETKVCMLHMQQNA